MAQERFVFVQSTTTTSPPEGAPGPVPDPEWDGCGVWGRGRHRASVDVLDGRLVRTRDR